MVGKVPNVYLNASGRLEEFLRAVQRGNAPTRFTIEHLETMGFKSKADRQFIPLLKALGFLDESNVPTQAYRDYLDPARARAVLGRQILNTYDGLFELEREAHKLRPSELQGKFKSIANQTEAVSALMASTFAKLCSLADIDAARGAAALKAEAPQAAERDEVMAPSHSGIPSRPSTEMVPFGLSYNIQINLPNTTDVEVFRSIFKALRENLLR